MCSSDLIAEATSVMDAGVPRGERLMSDQAYDLSQFIEDLRSITHDETDDKKIIQRVSPLAQKFAASPGLIKDEYYQCDQEQGFSLHLLHEDEDHSNAVFVIAWLPDRGTLAHNHMTWGIVVGKIGRASCRERV